MKAILVCLVVGVAGLSVNAAENPDRGTPGTKKEVPAAAQVHQTTGVVKSVDAAKGTVMIAHDPVPTLQWSAMTMPFYLDANLAKGIQAGQKVKFQFTADGMNGTITKIEPVK